MTRKRTRESIEHVLCNECPTCHGRGTVKTVETVCYEIMREIVRVHHAYDSDRFTVYASPAVAGALKGEESHSLAEVEIFVGKQVKVQIEPLYNREQFDRRNDVNRCWAAIRQRVLSHILADKE